MKYTFGERLRLAREYARLTQDQLSAKSGVKQGTISKIERGESDSSTFTVRLAIACNVRPEWLELESGLMARNDGYTINDPKLIALCRVMEEQAEYVKDAAVKEVTQILELIDHAKQNNRTNG